MLSLSQNQMFEFVRRLLHSLTPSSRLMTRRYMGYVTGGIRAGVETLGPNWAQNAATCFTLELHVY